MNNFSIKMTERITVILNEVIKEVRNRKAKRIRETLSLESFSSV